MNYVCIAEKPSVARSIAAILGANEKRDGFMEGNGYIVTWAFGHLVGLAMPEHYGITGFKRENLPILPKEFMLVPRQIKEGKEYKNDPGVMKQLNIIKELFSRAEGIIVCMDSGREGENIFRYIYHYLNCHKPFQRLWISSLTDKAIREGFQNLKPGSDYDNLYLAAKARSESDWLVGLNSSQSLSIAAGSGVYSLGRVQTPTLAMICKRYLENKHFIPVPFWQHKLNLSKESIPFSTISVDKYETKLEASQTGDRIYQGGIAKVKSKEKKTLNQEPPLLYDLTTLQKEANNRHGFSADKTLSNVQSLYEKKCTTYPRTGSRYISTDVFDEIPQLIDVLRQHKEFEPYIRHMDNKILTLKSVDGKKVTDHHALLITENFPEGLSKDEQLIYDMIAGRMLEAFSPLCIKEQTIITFDAREHPFVVKNTKMIKAGWRGVFYFDHASTEKDENEEEYLPELEEGEELEIISLEVLEKQTKPKPIHTESSLLSAMENAAKEIEDEELRDSLKDCGIGTPATRAAIIETLLRRDYIKREKKSLVPTEKGLSVYEVVKNMRIADVEMSGQWENALLKIEQGTSDAATFRKAIEVYTKQVTDEILSSKIQTTGKETCLCPKCRSGQMQFYSKVVKCNNPDCALPIFKTIADKQLADKQVCELLEKGKTGIIKGFTSKTGKTFDASLVLDESFKVTFSFPERGKPTKNRK